MKKLLAMLLVFCMIFALANIGVAEDAGFNITACIASEPETLDPNLISSVDGSTYTQHTYEGLMKYYSTGELAGEDDAVIGTEIVLGQAAKYEVSEDGLTYTFTLRDDIVWSDGVPVTAKDFEFSWKRIVDPANASDYGYILDGIVVNAAAIQGGEKPASELGITAVDDKTLVINLESACPYFVELCAFADLVPLRQDIVEADPATWFTNLETIVTNGPFVYSEWVHDSYIKMVKNNTYYNAAEIGPDSITWYLSDSETAILSAYEAGEYQFIENPPTDRIADLQASGDLFILPYVGNYYLYLNCEKITDWRVRAAINLAIDRENIVENVTQAGQIPATGMVAAGIANSENAEWTDTYGAPLTDFLAASYPDYDLDIYMERCELARELLAAAIADGTWTDTSTVEYCFNTSESHKAIAEAVQADLVSILGINCVLSNQDWNVYTNGLAEGTFGMARLGWIADYNDAITYLELFTIGNSYNYGRWVSEEYTELIAKAKSLPGCTERDEAMAKAETILFGEGGFAIAPLYFYTNMYCLHEGLNNVIYTPFGYYMFSYATK